MKQCLSIALIGHGAVARYVIDQLAGNAAITISALICRPGSRSKATRLATDQLEIVTSIDDLNPAPDLLVDCAGHSGLAQHGPKALAAGIDIISISTGAMADPVLAEKLFDAAQAGKSKLKLLSGAIGGIDALSAARIGGLQSVTYTGRKPPLGWIGSPAEKLCDLENLTGPFSHFAGTAREAALLYPKNANVAATIALAGIGFDATNVKLIADPGISKNIHEITAKGEFGTFQIIIEGNALPTNPKTSALAAMSIVRELNSRIEPVGL